MSKYINPYTDFGFKKLFGEEANKDLLIDFLNQLVETKHQIADLVFKNPEKLPNTYKERRAIYDIHCTSLSGEKFIVEMQKASVEFFKDRSLFYSTIPIREQAKKGKKWNFELKAVYFVAILDFEYDEEEDKRKFRRDVMLKDQDGDEFYNKLHFKFLQMPLFNKKEKDLQNHFDKWCYFLKNLVDFKSIPAILNLPIFQKAFKTTEVAAMNIEQYGAYEQSLIDYWDNTSVVANAVNKAVDKAVKKAVAATEVAKTTEIAKNLILKGFENELISELTGLTLLQIEELRIL